MTKESDHSKNYIYYKQKGEITSDCQQKIFFTNKQLAKFKNYYISMSVIFLQITR